jgi:hypothetical protein
MTELSALTFEPSAFSIQLWPSALSIEL